jgi:hypothetical protein
MKHKHTYICKPGCYFEPKEGKTNLQIRELEALRSAFNDAGVPNELITIPQLLNKGIDIAGSAIIVFNSAKCFDDELYKLMSLCSVLDDIDITFVSNDCRLNFNYASKEAFKPLQRLTKRFEANDGVTMRVFTNASVDLDDYATIIADWFPEDIPVYFSALWTLPAFMPGANIAQKTVDSVFACMHFKDYSKERQELLVDLKMKFEDRLVLTGDMSTMIVNGKEVKSIVTDTKYVWQWYCNAKTTPVLLEPNYNKFGVIPNRVAEAIACRCMPVVLCIRDNYRLMDNLPVPVVEDKTLLAGVMQNYINQYNEPSVQNQLDLLQASLAMYKTMLCQQLMTFFA